MLRKISSNSQEHIEDMKIMKELNNKSAEPKVGLFWYDLKRNKLVGVHKISLDNAFDNGNGRKTIDELHKDVFKDISDFYPQYNDFMDMERGRVFYNYRKNIFIVKVGDWIEMFPNVKQLIINNFNLPVNTEFSIDEHWNVGCGESDLY
jgi:hypothetical protein